MLVLRDARVYIVTSVRQLFPVLRPGIEFALTASLLRGRVPGADVAHGLSLVSVLTRLLGLVVDGVIVSHVVLGSSARLWLGSRIVGEVSLGVVHESRAMDLW